MLIWYHNISTRLFIKIFYKFLLIDITFLIQRKDKEWYCIYFERASSERTNTLYPSRSTWNLKVLAPFHPLQLLFPSTLTYFSVGYVGERTFPHACSTDFVERGSNHGSLFSACARRALRQNALPSPAVRAVGSKYLDTAWDHRHSSRAS